MLDKTMSCDECPKSGDVYVCEDCKMTVTITKECACSDPHCVCLCCCDKKMCKVN